MNLICIREEMAFLILAEAMYKLQVNILIVKIWELFY